VQSTTGMGNHSPPDAWRGRDGGQARSGLYFLHIDPDGRDANHAVLTDGPG